MPYYVGTAEKLEDLQGAIVSACVLNGWGYNEEKSFLSKGACNFRLKKTNLQNDVYSYYPDLDCIVLSDAEMPLSYKSFLAVAGCCPDEGNKFVAPAWPCQYHCFVFPAEVYFWFEPRPGYWQWLAFGLSNLAGLPSPAPWYGGQSRARSVPAASYYVRGTVLV